MNEDSIRSDIPQLYERGVKFKEHVIEMVGTAFGFFQVYFTTVVVQTRELFELVMLLLGVSVFYPYMSESPRAAPLHNVCSPIVLPGLQE